MSHIPWRIGVPDGTLSGLERLEGLDTFVLVTRVWRLRGAGNADGDVVIMGTQVGIPVDAIRMHKLTCHSPRKEKTDTTSFEASQKSPDAQENSHLAIVQWHIASQQQLPFQAMAPWEACVDLYRERFVRGHAFDSGLFDFILTQIIRSQGGLFRNVSKIQTQNTCWKDNRVDFSRIKISAYTIYSYSALVHTMDSIRGYARIPYVNKWCYHALSGSSAD